MIVSEQRRNTSRSAKEQWALKALWKGVEKVQEFKGSPGCLTNLQWAESPHNSYRINYSERFNSFWFFAQNLKKVGETWTNQTLICVYKFLRKKGGVLILKLCQLAYFCMCLKRGSRGTSEPPRLHLKEVHFYLRSCRLKERRLLVFFCQCL